MEVSTIPTDCNFIPSLIATDNGIDSAFDTNNYILKLIDRLGRRKRIYYYKFTYIPSQEEIEEYMNKIEENR